MREHEFMSQFEDFMADDHVKHEDDENENPADVGQ